MNISSENLPPTFRMPKPGEKVYGYSRATLYRMLGEGKIKGLKQGKILLIVTSSVIDNLRSLPEADFRKKSKISTN